MSLSSDSDYLDISTPTNESEKYIHPSVVNPSFSNNPREHNQFESETIENKDGDNYEKMSVNLDEKDYDNPELIKSKDVRSNLRSQIEKLIDHVSSMSIVPNETTNHMNPEDYMTVEEIGNRNINLSILCNIPKFYAKKDDDLVGYIMESSGLLSQKKINIYAKYSLSTQTIVSEFQNHPPPIPSITYSFDKHFSNFVTVNGSTRNYSLCYSMDKNRWFSNNTIYPIVYINDRKFYPDSDSRNFRLGPDEEYANYKMIDIGKIFRVDGDNIGVIQKYDLDISTLNGSKIEDPEEGEKNDEDTPPKEEKPEEREEIKENDPEKEIEKIQLLLNKNKNEMDRIRGDLNISLGKENEVPSSQSITDILLQISKCISKPKIDGKKKVVFFYYEE